MYTYLSFNMYRIFVLKKKTSKTIKHKMCVTMTAVTVYQLYFCKLNIKKIFQIKQQSKYAYISTCPAL